MTDDDRHTLRDALYVVFKRRLRIGVVTLGAMAAGVGYNALAGASYTASARIVATAAAWRGGAGGRRRRCVFQDRGQLARSQAALFGDPGLLRPLLPALKARLQTNRPKAGGGVSGTGRRLVRRTRRSGRGSVCQFDPCAERCRDRRHRCGGASLHLAGPRFAADALNLILSGDENGGVARGRCEDWTSSSPTRRCTTPTRRCRHWTRNSPRCLSGRTRQRWSGSATGLPAASPLPTAPATRCGVERELAQRKLDTVEQAFRNGGWVDSPDAQDTPSGAPALQQTFVTLLDKHQTMLTHLPPDSASVRAVDAQIGQVREQNFLAVKQLLTSKIASLDARLSRLDADIAADESGARNTDDKPGQARCAGADAGGPRRARAAAAQRRLR